MPGRIKVAPPEQRTMDGIVFHSKKEMIRYSELKMLLKCGIITEFKRQQKWPLVVNGNFICNYLSDFTYKDQNQNLVIEDVKGMRTEMYDLKYKLFHAVYPKLRIIEL